MPDDVETGAGRDLESGHEAVRGSARGLGREPDGESERDRVYRALMSDPRATADFITSMLEREALLHPAAPHPAAGETSRYPALSVVEGVPAILAAVQSLQRAACRQIRVIDVPPYAGSDDYYGDQEILQRARMAAGVAYRVIYSGAAFDDPVSFPNMTRMIEVGEQARALDDPPMKLVIGDDDLAVLTLGPDQTVGAGPCAVLLRPSNLFDNMAAMFETLWNLAVPVSASGVDLPIGDRDRQILSLMASGATDDAIARSLGLGRRTVVRRVSALLTSLGASNRFQAGVQAARRGWL